MELPLYSDHGAPRTPGDGHKGLWFERFFNKYGPNWKIIEATPQNEDGKKQWIETVKGRCGDEHTLKGFAARQANLCALLDGESFLAKTEWHFATGMGNPHPVENGFVWHPTLGVPYLTGAAVKGLVRAWVESWMEFTGTDDHERIATLYRWFGSEDKDPKQRADLRDKGVSPPKHGEDLDTEAGGFIFFDAVPYEPVTLAADIMTPHYGKWYEKGGEIQDADTESDKVPADWHDPVPIPFLVVKKATFLFSIAPRTGEAKQELDPVIKALRDALTYLGAGAKTAVGYGTMSQLAVDGNTLRDLLEKQKQLAEAAAQKAKKTAERQKELSTMDPFERSIQEKADARPDKVQNEISYILNLVKQGQWRDDEKIKVARWLEKKMKSLKGQWKEQTQKKKPEKDREYTNTLLVKGWLNGK